MTDTLFPDLPQTPSPRLAWIQKHGLELHEFNSDHVDEFGPHQRWICSADSRTIGTGATEDEALGDWARKKGVKLWNEKL